MKLENKILIALYSAIAVYIFWFFFLFQVNHHYPEQKPMRPRPTTTKAQLTITQKPYTTILNDERKGQNERNAEVTPSSRAERYPPINRHAN